MNADTKTLLSIGNLFYPIALQYLDQWYRSDRYRVEAIRSGTRAVQVEALRDLAQAYSLGQSILMHMKKTPSCRVAGDGQFSELAGELEVALQRDHEEWQSIVWDVAKVVGKIFARKEVSGEKETIQLSAATKFLWFAGLERIRIYDRQAYRALLGKTPPPMTIERYRGYCERWEQAFSTALPAIRTACDALSLPSSLAWSIAGHMSHDVTGEIETEICSLRFAERVFDRALWLLGAEFGVPNTCGAIRTDGNFCKA